MVVVSRLREAVLMAFSTGNEKRVGEELMVAIFQIICGLFCTGRLWKVEWEIKRDIWKVNEMGHVDGRLAESSPSRQVVDVKSEVSSSIDAFEPDLGS